MSSVLRGGLARAFRGDRRGVRLPWDTVQRDGLSGPPVRSRERHPRSGRGLGGGCRVSACSW